MKAIRIQVMVFLAFICSGYAYADEEIVFTQKHIDKIIQQTADRTAQQVYEKLSKNTPIAAQSQVNQKTARQLPVKHTATKILRMGSGVVGGNYFVLGELVGGVVSHPIGSLPCGHGGTCGIPNLQSQNVTSAGSVVNLYNLLNGKNHTGFVQSDIAYWGYTGTGLFENKEKLGNVRAIASLYPEAMHVVVKKSANINSIADLSGKKVSIGSKSSGTLHVTRLILAAYNLTEDDLDASYLNGADSIKKLRDGELDAIFFTVGTPAPAFEQLFDASSDYTLLPIAGSEREKIFKKGHYFSPYSIKANIYKNIPQIDTISVYALWLTTEKIDEKLVYELTKSLWGEDAKQLFNSSIIGKQIKIENSLKGIGIPLHRGAKKYYNEIGKRF